jgi:hypothetical protein
LSHIIDALNERFRRYPADRAAVLMQRDMHDHCADVARRFRGDFVVSDHGTLVFVFATQRIRPEYLASIN